MPSIYLLKPGFKRVLHPLARALVHFGVEANHVTVLACALSVGIGLWLTPLKDKRDLLILPLFLLIRMAMNAIDGVMAKEFGQKTDVGAYLNELGDVVSDAFVYLPFAYLPPFEPFWVAAAIVLSVISETAGLPMLTGTTRRYDGPMGKSDRALVFGAMAGWIGVGGNPPLWLAWTFPRLIAILLVATIVNRVRSGLAQKKAGAETVRR